ncbi:hypothetical protein D3OALGB2SA_2618, partial [Olavius algarvensis associated proteobacterium Delta 3]
MVTGLPIGLPEDTISLDFDGSDGELLHASGAVRLEVSGFFYAGGTFSFEKRIGSLTVTDGVTAETVPVDQLLLDAHVDSAFAGVNGPADSDGDGIADNPSALGLQLTDVEIGLGFFKPQDTADTRSWTSLKAEVGSAESVGTDDLTMS